MKKKIIYVGLAVVTFILLDTLIFDNIFGKNANTNNIAELLSEELHCKDINTMSANGFLISKGIYGDSHFVTIQESDLTNITKKEATKIQEVFKQNLENFKEANYIELTFNDVKTRNNTIVFKKGVITTP